MTLPAKTPKVVFDVEDLAADDNATITLVALVGRVTGEHKTIMGGTALAVGHNGIVEQRRYDPAVAPTGQTIEFETSELLWNLSSTPGNALGGGYEYTAWLTVSTEPGELVEVRYRFQLNEDVAYVLDGEGRIPFAQVDIGSAAITLPAELSTPGALLADLKTVDGDGSGLDADTVDGLHAADLVPAGGTTGQILTKSTDDDNDVEWSTVAGAGDMLAAVYDPQSVGGDAFARANHTGQQAAATISDFDTEVTNNPTVTANTAAASAAQDDATDALAAAAAALQPAAIGVTVQAHSAILDATTASFTTDDETKLDGIDAGAKAPINDDTLASASTTHPPVVANVIAYVAARVAALVASAPGVLDTLDEIAAALGDDPDFAATITALIADKAAISDTVLKAAFDANTILTADTDNTPAALEVAEERLVGRVTGGSIAPLTVAQVRTLLGITAFAATILDDADPAAARATLEVVNNATHTGEVTGSGALTIQPTAITNKPAGTVAAGDLILVSDESAAGALVNVTAQSIADLGGGGGSSDPLDGNAVIAQRIFIGR